MAQETYFTVQLKALTHRFETALLDTEIDVTAALVMVNRSMKVYENVT